MWMTGLQMGTPGAGGPGDYFSSGRLADAALSGIGRLGPGMEVEDRPFADARGPAGRHRLQPGVEAHTFHPVDMVIAEQ